MAVGTVSWPLALQGGGGTAGLGLRTGGGEAGIAGGSAFGGGGSATAVDVFDREKNLNMGAAPLWWWVGPCSD
jgi:hypothetical protein